MKNQRHNWFDPILTVLVVGVTAAAILSAARLHRRSGPNLQQRQTMMAIRDLAIAIESYNTDNNFYPAPTAAAVCQLAGGTFAPLASNSWTSLKPTYIAVPPTVDGWKGALQYESGAPSGSGYDIMSAGKDGTTSGLVCGTTTDFNSDIIYSNGTFIQWPEGPQQ